MTIACGISNGRVDPVDMMMKLADAGLTRIFCEGGGTLAASLLHAGLVDEVVGFTAGLMIGSDGTASVGAMGLDKLGDAPKFTLSETRQIGPDLLHRWARA